MLNNIIYVVNEGRQFDHEIISYRNDGRCRVFLFRISQKTEMLLIR